jgi:hypothetical protein
MADNTLLDSFLYYGLFLGGMFQLMCILAIVFVPPSSSEDAQEYYEETTSGKKTQGVQRSRPERKKKR